MLTTLQAAILGVLQGVTELFPISSLGHSVILPGLLGWQIDQASDYFLPFLVLTHLATALVLLGFFWRDWLYLIQGVLRSFFTRSLKGDPYAKLGWMLIVGTIPAGLLGLIFQTKLAALFADPKTVAIFLALNGILLGAIELLRRRGSQLFAGGDARIARLSFLQTLGVGTMQALALLPGFSRTGAALGGGLVAGLAHEDAARFSFLLATPIILAAAVLKVPHILHAPSATLVPALVGALCAAVAAFFSVRFLTHYFKTNTLLPFAIYCLLAGVVSFFLM